MKKGLSIRFMEERVVELKKKQRNGTAYVYQNILSRLKNFMNGREITFSQLIPEQLTLSEQKLLADQFKWNTISTYMRMLRFVYNQALERGVATYVPRLFNKVHTGIDCLVERAVLLEVICRLMTDRKPLPRELVFSRDLFVFLLLFRGMPSVDLAFLCRYGLQGNVVMYHRRKTNHELIMMVGEEAMEIIQRHMYINPDSSYLFPIIQNPGKDEYGQYARMLRPRNYRLTQAAHILGVRDRLSIYITRHTWVTAALRQNYNSSLACDAMGHSSIKVTETYFQPYRDDEVNRMNNSFITRILSKKKKGADKNLRS